MTWEEIAAKEGRLYCQREDTWCALINMDTGGCTRDRCIKEEKMLYCKLKGVMCACVDDETGECAAAEGCVKEDV